MRSFATSILAFIASLFVGGMIVQVFAVESGGQEEWIIAFGLTFLVAAAAAVVFLVMLLASGTRTAAWVTMTALIVLFALFAGGPVAWSVWVGGANSGNDWPLMAGLILPGVAIILVQWLIVRWRAPQEQTTALPRFGRGATPT